MKKKYIIALEDRNVWSCGVPAKTLLLSDVSIFGTDLSSVNTGIELTPYTEPDTEKVREEVFKNGYDAACKDIDIKSKINAAYRKGLDDAWECARKIVDCAIPYEALENYLEIGECTADVIKHLPASKAIEVVRQYEQEKDRLARIEYNFDEIKDVLETTVKECNVSLDEIAEVLQKMKETDNG